jgi:2-iminobutanoate/2-iminopropanoate deaminase
MAGRPTVIHTEQAAAPTGPFAQAMRAGDFVFVAGQRGIEPGTGALAAGTREKVRQAFENIRAILEAAGTSFEYVVMSRVYVRDMAGHRPIVNEAYQRYFPKGQPPRTIVEVARLNQDDEVEIEVVAWVPPQERTPRARGHRSGARKPPRRRAS